MPELDENQRPVLNPDYLANPNALVESVASFAQWFKDGGDSINHVIPGTLRLDLDAATGMYRFQRNTDNGQLFFPVDGLGFADRLLASDGLDHNFWFTSEIVSSFSYTDPASRPGQALELTFTGDDDVFVFINHRLALSLGGIHPETTETINVDELASELGLVGGNAYDFRVFHAERRRASSNFLLETNLELGRNAPVRFSYD